MANKKTDTFKVQRDAQKGEFATTKSPKPYAAPLEAVKREVQRGSLLPVKDTKTGLRNAISEAARHDAQNSESRTIKEARRDRRDIIVKTIMRYNRQSR